MLGQDSRLADLARRASKHSALQLLVLYGSRARGDARSDSDWDLGYLADPWFDPDALLADAIQALGSDRIDLADLARASGQLRYRAAAEAQVLFARSEDVFQRFWLDAVTFWCDAAPVLRTGYRELLNGVAQ